MTRHVVFGTGQIGRLVAEQLGARGVDVVAVNRNGDGRIDGARVAGGDAADPAVTTRAAAGAGAEVVYFCLNAMSYTRWVEEFPPLQRAVVTAAQAAGARLVALDNLYAYGPTGGRDLVESLQARPASAKAATRVAMTTYQFTDRWVVDDSKFRGAFGDQATPLDHALATTLRWYRDRTASHQAA
jgi:nucleoside-diphosphate-sugar epimerase